MPRFLLRQGNNAATAAARVRCNVHQRNLVGARASTRPAHSMPVFIDESPGKRRRHRQRAILWLRHLLNHKKVTDELTKETKSGEDA